MLNARYHSYLKVADMTLEVILRHLGVIVFMRMIVYIIVKGMDYISIQQKSVGLKVNKIKGNE